MALIVYITGTGPGRALVEIKGAKALKGDLSLAVKRGSDGAYIGAGSIWQATPSWHRLQPGSGTGAGRLVIGPELVDALADAVPTAGFLAQLRWRGGEAEAGLRIRGELFRSDAEIPPPRDDEEESDPKPGPIRPNKRPRWPWVAGLAGLLVALGLGALELGWFDEQPPEQAVEDALAEAAQTEAPDSPQPLGEAPQPGLAQSAAEAPEAEPTLEPEPGMAPEPEPEPGLTLEPEPEPDLTLEPEPEPDLALEPEPRLSQQPPSEPLPEPQPAPQQSGSPPTPDLQLEDYRGLSGSEYANKVINSSPPPVIILEHAKSRSNAMDCTAAFVLRDRAAMADARTAYQVARLYDPQGFVPTPCITESDQELARGYYELAAEGGIPRAQLRLGQILTEGQDSGRDYEMGIEWLDKAEAAGAREAQSGSDDPAAPEEPRLRTFENR